MIVKIRKRNICIPEVCCVSAAFPSSSAISDVTSPVKLVGIIRKFAIALGSKPPLVTWIARTGLGTRLYAYLICANYANASVNSSCAQPAPLGLTLGISIFFCLGWQIPGDGDS